MGRLVKRFGHVLPGEVLDARGQATALLRAAQDEAQRLLREARVAAEAIREEARLAGWATGQAEAETAFTSLMLAARRDAEGVRAAAVPGARKLAVRMAEKIVGHALRLDPTALVRIVGEALAAVRARSGPITLRVHPEDKAAVEAARPELLARVGTTMELSLVADVAVDRGGCIVETPVGRLDARLATQLAALERAVYGDARPASAKKGVSGG
ncbi:MAG: FliH/SctL family protein [Myxococcales bacterium]